MSVLIRRATLDDLNWLVEQLRSFAHFIGYSSFELFPTIEHAEAVLTEMIDDHIVMIAADSEGERLGLIGGLVGRHPFNPEVTTLTEVFWWVDQKHRGSRAGLKLLDEFIAWGTQNVKLISLSLEHHSPVSDRCYTRRGFSLREKTYVMEVA